jgi:hypothetical protein
VIRHAWSATDPATDQRPAGAAAHLDERLIGHVACRPTVALLTLAPAL